jgi:tRNA-specific 2-thiouridylase
MGADYVATGHYVRLSRTNIQYPISNIQQKQERKKLEIGNWKLEIAKDVNKDQSYFLWTLDQKSLAHCLFPIGDHLKPKVREIARKAKLPTADKKDSQGICFLGMVDIFDFLKQYIPEHRGALITTSGETIGEHFGSEFYTIGQRHIDADFKFPKTGATARKPFYVAAKDAKTNTVVVAEGNDNAALYKKEVRLADVHFISSSYSHVLKNMRIKNPRGRISGAGAEEGMPVLARVRYRQPLAKAILVREKGERRRKKESWSLAFAQPQKFVAPGQSAVFYDKNGVMLGGGVIL